MKRKLNVTGILIVLGFLALNLAASVTMQDMAASRLGRGRFPIQPPLRPPPITNPPLPPIRFTNCPPIRHTNLPPILITNCTPSPAGLVGWWKGDGNTLDSALGNNGVAQNITYTDGIVGQAFVFLGSSSWPHSRISVPDQPVFALTNSLSIEGWINPAGANGTSGMILWRGDCRGGYDPYFLQMNEDNTLGFYIEDETGGPAAAVNTPVPLANHQWYHVAATLDGNTGTMSIYINGVLAAQTNTPLRPFGALDPSLEPSLGIGNVGTACWDYVPFNGAIDEISLYSRALSAGEIQAIYSAGTEGKCPITASTNCMPPPSGLISWWPGEGNANDIVGTNNGLLENVTFASGMVGQGFYLNHSNADVKIPASSSLDVGSGGGLTLEAWINPADVSQRCPLFEWNVGDGTTYWGAHFYIDPVSFGAGPGALYANIVDNNGYWHQVHTGAGAVTANVFQHVALTYDKASGVATIYCNGVAVVQESLGSFTPLTTYNLYLGRRPLTQGEAYTFAGLLDEPCVYNRALSPAEIAAIYNAGNAGKCPITPSTNCAPPPSGLIGWWPGESNANDVVSANNGVAQNITYTTGVVGQAFACDPDNYPYGTYAGIQVPDSPAYALTNSLTIEGWVRPRGDSYSIFWRGDNRPGMDPYYLAMWGNNNIRFAICDADNNVATVGTYLTYNQWMHVAATLDGSTGTMSIYTNGVLADQIVTAIRPFGDLIPEDSPGIGIGNINDGGNNFPFIGDIDEISLYNRALAAAEVQAIYHAGTAGKCTGSFPPVIIVQPVNQTTVAGSNVVLSVDVSGTGPFSYQWRFNGTNIPGATNATLTLTNLHPCQSGSYAVTVTTPDGSITSSNASITVIARDILIYKYCGIQKTITAGQALSYAYAGQMFFTPDNTNGVFVGWAAIKGKKQYWVNPLPEYLWITIAGVSNQTFTVLGQAGQGIDTNGCPNLWSDLHKGKNTQLTIGQSKYFSFPNTFANDATHVYPDPQTGKMVLSESSSMFIFAAQNTQKANNTGQTLADLVNALTQSLAGQGYQKQEQD
jgi:hypothetical protein